MNTRFSIDESIQFQITRFLETQKKNNYFRIDIRNIILKFPCFTPVVLLEMQTDEKTVTKSTNLIPARFEIYVQIVSR